MIGFVINPVSGNGRGMKVWYEIKHILQEKNINYVESFTNKVGSGTKCTLDLIHKYKPKIIVAVGGDGTVHEVINGVYQADVKNHIHFGYIPSGSGNDYARGVNLPKNPMKALDVILHSEKRKRLDLLKIDNEVAVCSIGTGLDGKVAQITNEAKYKKWLNGLRLGGLAYVISLFRVLFSFKTSDITLNIDGEVKQLKKVWFIAVSNLPFYGGGMLINPQAIPDDEKAEICIVSNINSLELLTLFPLVYFGKHAKHKAVSFLSGKKIEYVPSHYLTTQADGETIKVNKYKIDVLPKHITIVK
ncbi:diacylglycerol/lipid kinase family protein [Chengkuizengella axinellae]|uniref:Diacylglycerol kinase family lipid kinase n=1 Tax=Chengkuizengella axinellae TaxID=3064388 RepID=A0ABT9IUG6_9BACL|nr:diacylglycerol kinase family protein [Chengkuizengella sp. 2205SS18-9]MDP5272973.1 diacylglycerol kinase family lipid kinase [Chengkuizengella sp. 2205SS18-9]